MEHAACFLSPEQPNCTPGVISMKTMTSTEADVGAKDTYRYLFRCCLTTSLVNSLIDDFALVLAGNIYNVPEPEMYTFRESPYPERACNCIRKHLLYTQKHQITAISTQALHMISKVVNVELHNASDT